MVDIKQAPRQHMAPLVRQMCTRNRTKAACGQRTEAKGLTEIDYTATEGDTKGMTEEDRHTLGVVRTGSAWNRVAAYWAGQSSTKLWQLCGLQEEGPTHIWECASLRCCGQEVDSQLAEIDPGSLPPSIKVGIAPAMAGDFKDAFWGNVPGENEGNDPPP